MSLSRDIVSEILKRVDGITLAKAGCCCSDLRSIADQETLWEHLCRSLWPSTGNEGVQSLISSFGGFKKLYANCFPLVDVSKQIEDHQKNFNPSSFEDYDDEVHDDTVSLSDFVSLVDIHYNNKAIYSEVSWKIPAAHDIMIDNRSSTIFPLVINLPCDTSEGGLFPISTINEKEDVERNLRLSWILINTKTKHAVNLSSWRTLQAQRLNWGCGGIDFTIRFGSILPYHDNGLPPKLAACNIVMICRVETMNLQVRGVSMQLEDMMGCQVNARDGAVILQRALEWTKRTNDHGQVIQRCHDVEELQSDFMEGKLEGECQMNPLCIIFSLGVTALLSSYYFFL
ncbi:hypothetical protein KI387_042420 [Taxus chinensis]|uniref:F-box domain-containing protein n=1 Tax=Taxus chinensis TaxID=29808 RepID=A0AA38F4Z4_TAXCH|nr:hypothetical protein KI387_042420 [Taxus chinensis]